MKPLRLSIKRLLRVAIVFGKYRLDRVRVDARPRGARHPLALGRRVHRRDRDGYLFTGRIR